jgi:methyl-accepting chemotaxis protein
MALHFRSLLGSLSGQRNSGTGNQPTASDALRGRPPEAAPAVDRAGTPADDASNAGSDWAKEILDLIELEVGAMIRRLERAANSVAGGAESTASTLSTIRRRTDALIGRTSAAQATATSFSLAAEKFTLSARDIAAQVRDARRLADLASTAAEEARLNVDRLRASSTAIGDVINLIAQIAKQTTLLALNSTIEAARAGPAGKGFAVVATEVKALAVQTKDATEEIKRKIDALQRDATDSVGAVHRISQAIEAIRPVFENVNGAVDEQNRTTGEMSDNAASASQFIVAVADNAAEIDSATREAAAHGDDVADAGKAVTTFAQKLRSRCAVLLRQGEREDRRKNERLPCNLKIDLRTSNGAITAPVYQISMEGILIGGPEAGRLPEREILDATLETAGSCRIRVVEHSKAGARALFERLDPQLSEKIEDVVWSIHEENTEFVTRTMQAGTVLARIFEEGVTGGTISADDMFDTNYVEIGGTNPLQYRSRILSWSERALPDFQEKFLAENPTLAFCACLDRNGYLPVHNKMYSHPQRPGDVAWNTANSRNRRIFNDPEGLAASRNLRSYLIQSYARDMGGGKNIMLKEISVPIRVNGQHWGCFRTVWTPHRRGAAAS